MTEVHPPRQGPVGGGDGPGTTMVAPSSAPIVHLEGFDGPMDLLLELARAQKVDLWRISILQLVEQYLAVVRAAQGMVRLEQAADWLVMAAWLAWLKSRLLLPEDDEEATDAEEAAALLHERLLELERMVQLGRWLGARDQLGLEVFERGQAESLVEVDRSGLAVEVPQLMRGYMAAMRRRVRKSVYQRACCISGRCRTPWAACGGCWGAWIRGYSGAGWSISCLNCPPGRYDGYHGRNRTSRRRGRHAAGQSGDGAQRRDRTAAGRAVRPYPAA